MLKNDTWATTCMRFSPHLLVVITSLFFDIGGRYGAGMHTSLKVKERKRFQYVCAAYDPHNRFHMNDVNRLRFLLFRKSSDYKLRKLSPTKKALQLHILRSAYAVRLISAVTYNQVIKCHLRLTGDGITPRAIGLLWIGAEDMMLMTCWCKWIHTYLYLQRILLPMQVCEERSIMSSVL